MKPFDEILREIRSGVEDLARLTLSRYVAEAKLDATSFVDESAVDLKRWTSLLAEGRLSTADFEWLVNARKDLAEMHALKQAGLAQIRIEQFRNSLVNLVIDTVFRAVLPG